MFKKRNLEKYKTVLLSVLIFVLIDLSVLVFNFYISYQISQDTIEINLAGRQQTLTQRITKNLLEFERAYHKSRDYQLIVEDIESSMKTFDETLSAFDVGGDIVIPDRLVTVNPVEAVNARQAIETAKPMWAIYKNYTADVLSEFKGRQAIDEDLVTVFFRESIVKDVVVYTTRNDIALLDVMTDLTDAVERVAFEKTRKLRFAQAIAIFIAVVNFFFIVFFSIRHLKRSDEKLTFAKAEMDVIFNTITEGVFLLDSDLNISHQYSKEMEIIFNDKDFGGRPLLSLLKSVSHDVDKQGVENFFHALFDVSKKLNVLEVLNPLQEVNIFVSVDDSEISQEKFLRFSYARIGNEYRVDRLLVRVVDISSEVRYEKIVHEERTREFKHLRLMSALMNSNADLLPGFFQKSFESLKKIKASLESYKKNYHLGLYDLEQSLAELRQDAEFLSLDALVELVDDFDASIKKLVLNEVPQDIQYVHVVSCFDNLNAHVESMSDFSSELLLGKGSPPSVLPSSGLLDKNIDWLHLEEFCSDVALSERKEVKVSTSGLNEYMFPKKNLQVINSIILQVFYHSITLSIEVPERRQRLRKDKTGLLDVHLIKKSNGSYCLTIKNDGIGVDYDKIKAKMEGLSAVEHELSGKIGKKELLTLLMFSCDPSWDQPASYNGELLFGNELLSLAKQMGMRLEMKSVAGEGAVFEFSFSSATI